MGKKLVFVLSIWLAGLMKDVLDVVTLLEVTGVNTKHDSRFGPYPYPSLRDI
jgi:hypothetical protein